MHVTNSLRPHGSFPYSDTEASCHASLISTLIPFVWPGASSTDSTTPLGYVLREVYSQIKLVPESVRGPLVEFTCPGSSSATYFPTSFTLFSHLRTEPERTALATRLCSHLRQTQKFPLLTHTWRDEAWPVYGPDNHTLLFSLERAAVGLLGLNRYGVHLTAYVVSSPPATGSSSSSSGTGRNSNNKKIEKVWVPRRSAAKQTWPGTLDNTVAGGLSVADPSPLDCVVREADEEASLPEDLVRRNIVFAGTVSYLNLTELGSTGATARASSDGGNAGGTKLPCPPKNPEEQGQDRAQHHRYVYPECQWIYDLPLPPSITPVPKDGEVESFMLMDLEEVKKRLAAGEFKPNCAVVMLDFLIRHGILTRDEDGRDWDEMMNRMHRRLPFPGPHRGFEMK